MAFPVVEATATDSGKSKNLGLNLPASIASGDLLVMCIAGRDDVGTGGIGWPAGWTELHDDLDSGDPRTAIGYRVADGTEGSSITVTMSSDRDLVSYCYRISGTSGNAPELGTATGSNASPNPPSLSPSWGSDDTLWLVYGSCDDGRAFTAAPTSYTDFTAQDRSQASSGTARRENATATEDPGTFTIDQSEPWQAVTIGIEPASAGGTDALTGTDLEAASNIDTPSIGQEHVLTGTDLSANSNVDTPSIGQTHVLSGTDVQSTSEITTPTIGQTHPLTGTDVQATSEIASPTVGQVHALSGTDVQGTSEITSPTVTETHALTGTDVQATSEITAPTLGQTHALSGADLNVTSEIDAGGIGQVHVLSGTDLQSTSEITLPTLTASNVVALTGVDLNAASEISLASIAQTHIMEGVDVGVSSEITSPTLTRIFSGWTEDSAESGTWSEESAASGSWVEEDGVSDTWTEESEL